MGYATLEDVRDEGVPESIDDTRVESLLILAQQYIERETGLFFEKRTAKTYELDGSDSPILELPAPALTITNLTIDGAVVAPGDYVNFNRPPDEMQDDFWYPRLVYKTSSTRLQRAFGNAHRSVWPMGQRNISITGNFGFVVTVGAQAEQTPPLIKRATISIVAALGPLAGDLTSDDRRRRFMTSETLGNYSYQLAEAVAGGGLTGDPEVDAIIARHTRARGAWAA